MIIQIVITEERVVLFPSYVKLPVSCRDVPRRMYAKEDFTFTTRGANEEADGKEPGAGSRIISACGTSALDG